MIIGNFSKRRRRPISADVTISQEQKEVVSRLRERKTSTAVYVAQLRPGGISLELLRGALTIADGFNKAKGIKLNLAPGLQARRFPEGNRSTRSVVFRLAWKY